METHACRHARTRTRIRLALGVGLIGRSGQRRVPQRTADARDDRRYVIYDQFNLSELIVPILADRALNGVLEIDHPQAAHYELDGQNAFLAIAERGAVQLKNLGGR